MQQPVPSPFFPCPTFFRSQARRERVPHAGNRAIVPQHLDIAAHRKPVARPPRGEALGDHARPADSGRLDRKSTRELQSRLHLVCRLLPEKKKDNKTDSTYL